MRRIAGSWPGLLVSAVVAVGCVSSPSPTPSAAATDVAAPSGEVASPAGSVPTPGDGAATAAPVDEAAIAYAVSQRKQFGMRSDEAWVRQVAADPRARMELLDFLMLPEEGTEFERRQASYDRMTGAVHRYADTRPADFGGVWIDQERHTVGTAWTTTPEIHRLAILASAGAAGPLEARLVRYSLKQLRDLQERIGLDGAWMRDIGAQWTGVGADEMANVTDLEISSANPLAPALILAHYGVPADMLRITSDGTGILLKERGTVHASVVTADGKVPAQQGLWPLWTPDRPMGSGDCGSEVGMGLDEEGTFQIDCAPGGWTFEIRAEGGIDMPVVGRGHVVVPEGGDVDLVITLEAGAGPSP